MTGYSNIYVALVGKGADARRPVKAVQLRENVYLIVDQPYSRDVETWEFEPGDYVLCELISSNGGEILAAIRKAI
jgi:hypothetical protein